MRILHTVESYTPTVSGMQEVVKQISERLVSKGHEVVVATKKVPSRGAKNINGVQVIDFDISGNFVRGLTGEVEEYKQFLLNNKFDVITNFAAQQWATDIALPILDSLDAVKVFVPTGFSGFYDKTYGTYFELMKNWIHKYDMNFFLSDDYRDVNFAKDNGVTKRMLVPNGADEREFLQKTNIDVRKQFNIPEDYFLIFHVGSHTGQKGHREAIEIFEKANIKKAALIICGNSHGGGCTGQCELKEKEFNESKRNLDSQKIFINKFLSREETVAAYKQSDLFIFPSNIECSPITMFECMASKLPYLATDVGNSREITEWSNGGVILKTSFDTVTGNSNVDIGDGISQLEKLFNDSEERTRLGNNGHKAWMEKFTWEEIANTYEKTYLKLADERRQKKYQNIKPSVDIILLTYNSSESIHNIINNIKEQSVRPQNIIIADYGSTDNTVELAHQLDLDIPVKIVSAENVINVRNKSIKEVKSDYFIFINDKSNNDKDLIKDFVAALGNTELENISLVYENYNAMAVNKNLEDRFSIFEFDLSMHGDIHNHMLSKNKILSTIENCLISKSHILSTGEFDADLGVMHEWDMLLRLATTGNVEYAFKYSNLNENKLYEPLVPYDHGFFESNITFFNKWSDRASKAALSAWANHLVWRTLLLYPSFDFVKVLNNTVNKSTKNLLFSKTFGSFKLYLMLYATYKFLKDFINNTKMQFSSFFGVFRTYFNIIRS